MRVQRWKTFGTADWILWGIMFAICFSFDGLDLAVLFGGMLWTLGLSVVFPEPILMLLGMMQVVLGKLFWNKSILSLVQLGSELVPIPLIKYLSAAPFLSVYAVNHLRELVEVETVPSRRDAASLVTVLISTGAGLLFWHFGLLPLTWAIAVTGGTWAMTIGLLRIDWSRVGLPRWVLAIGSAVMILLAALPVAYHLTRVTPESYREKAWEKMSDIGISAYFGNEVRAESLGEKGRSFFGDLWEAGKSFLGTESEEREAEDEAQRSRIERTLVLNPDVVRLREKGLLSSGDDFGRDFFRYHSEITGQVAFTLYRERLAVYLYLVGLMILVQILAWAITVAEKMPIKYRRSLPAPAEPFLLPPTPASRELSSPEVIELPSGDDKLLPP